MEKAIQLAIIRSTENNNFDLKVDEARYRYEVAKQNAKNYIQEQLNQHKYLQIKNELQSKIEKIEAEVISSTATRELFLQKEAELNQ
ncbi:Uncharacterised protein [Mycoplasmopsis arginini]|nr:Uncharacterised protein [Chlamydia abortus]SGA08038.1 Uncharacterised protein [Mycoplasmopsis arginini]SGA09213.1 Uncharacterised protein [Mycoplasmopsis arginini]SGA29881.1 Uncharacterised protein [Mycoplasmopsis arginini]SGA32020.1 Uncharacterised protein [Chlamydia abortus]